MKFNTIGLGMIIVVLATPCLVHSQNAYKAYSAYKQIPITGDGNWDYVSVDSKNRHLYLSHGEKVDIVDIDKDILIGEIGDQHGVHGIAIAGPENKGFISNGK